jgi:DNA-binding LacI/PurR family transcriptional regulator
MALRAGVCPTTMLNAVRLFRKAGVIASCRAASFPAIRSLHVAKRPEGHGIAPPQDRASEICAEICRRIADGVYRAGEPLPTAKELAKYHGTGYTTLQKALQRIESAGLVTRCRHRYQVRPSAHARRGSSIILIIPISRIASGIHSMTPHAQEFINSLEQECASRNVHLITESKFALLNASSHHRIRKIAGATTPLGAIVWTLSDHSFDARMAEMLLPLKLPLCLFNPVKPLPYDGAFAKRYPLTRVFNAVIDAAYGEEIGRFLLKLGHRHVALFGPPQAESVSVRLEGCAKVLAITGVCKTYRYCVDRAAMTATKAMTRAQTGNLERLRLRYTQALQDHGVPFSFHPNNTAVTVADARGDYEPLFARAVRERDVTAWVCTSDVVAILALEYCHTMKIRVPQRLSIVSFDDSPVAFENMLTSYNFNMPAAARRMVDYLLASPARRADVPYLSTIAGYIKERDTTAPPPR